MSLEELKIIVYFANFDVVVVPRFRKKVNQRLNLQKGVI